VTAGTRKRRWPASTDGPPTKKQLEVLQLLADGLSTEEIAARMFVSVETVKTHLVDIRAKLGAVNRAHAVALGLRANLIT
jgi:DNA-binding CsgD family transcriptional regulator